MPKKRAGKAAAPVLHVAKAWRDFGVRNKAGERVLQRKEEMCFVAMDDVDAHCAGAWHDQEHRYWAGIASSGRAECRKCGKKIAQHSLRIGIPRVRCRQSPSTQQSRCRAIAARCPHASLLTAAMPL